MENILNEIKTEIETILSGFIFVENTSENREKIKKQIDSYLSNLVNDKKV